MTTLLTLLTYFSGNVPIYTDPALLRPALPGRSRDNSQWSGDTLGPTLLDPSQIDVVENIKKVHSHAHI